MIEPRAGRNTADVNAVYPLGIQCLNVTSFILILLMPFCYSGSNVAS